MTAELVVQSGHGGSVTSVAFAPDGRTLATLGGSALKVWDAQTDDVKRTWGASSQAPLVFSPDGRFLVTAWNCRVQFWDRERGTLAGQMVLQLRKATYGEPRATFSPNGEWFALGLWNVTHVWKFADCLAQFDASLAHLPEPLPFPSACRILPYVGNALSLRFLPDSQTLIVGRADYGTHFDGTFLWDDGPAGEGKLDFWNVPTATLQTTLTAPFLWPTCLALSPDGSLLAVPDRGLNASLVAVPHALFGAWDGGILLLTLADMAEEKADWEPFGWETAEDKTAEDKTAAEAAQPGVRRLRGHSGRINSLDFAPDGRTLASCSYDGRLCLWDTAGEALPRDLKGHAGQINTLVFAPDGRTLATGSGEAAVIVWNAQTGEPLWTRQGSGGFLQGIGFTPDGQAFVAGVSARGKIAGRTESGLRLYGWNLHTGRHWPGEPQEWWFGYKKEPGHLTLLCAPDSVRFLTVGAEGAQPMAALWQPESAPIPLELDKVETLRRFAFSPDSARLTGTNGRTTSAWDAAAGMLLETVRFEQDTRTGQPLGGALALSPDGRTALCCAGPSPPLIQIALVDVWTGTTLHTLCEIKGYAYAAWFTADGSRVMVRASYEPLTVWDTRTGTRLGILDKCSTPIPASSPDGRWIAGRTDAQIIGLWDQETYALRADIVFESTPFDAYLFAWTADSRTLAGCDLHSSVYFWQAANGRLLGTLTLLSNRLDWIVTTPGGNYEASEGAAPFLRWRKGEQMLPFANFASGKYQPGLLKRILQPL